MFDSNHNAILIILDVSGDRPNISDPASLTKRLNFKNTECDLFHQKLTGNYDLHIPSDRNLTISEIDDYIQKINSIIHATIYSTVPVIKDIDSLTRLETHKIKRLQKQKVLFNLESKFPSKTRPDDQISSNSSFTNSQIREGDPHFRISQSN